MKIVEIDRNSNLFPQKLLEVKPLVKKIYAVGNMDLLNKKSIAVIGSRNCSDYGKRVAQEITKDISNRGYVIVSGMALGIDGIAHETCIINNRKTIAVLGSGFNHIYPKEHKKMFKQIVENGGLIISEHHPNEPVQMKNFPRRNRIISGLSEGILVVEGAYRSGTSITAKYAFKQGKKVFFVPNSIGSKNSYGVFKLAQEGGILVTCGDDIVQHFEEVNKNKYEAKIRNNREKLKLKIAEMDEISKKVVKCLLESGELSSNQLCEKTGICIKQINQAVSVLELEDVIVVSNFDKYAINEVFCE